MSVTFETTAMWDVTYSMVETYHHSVGTAISNFYPEGECNRFIHNNFYSAIWFRYHITCMNVYFFPFVVG